MTEAHGVSSPCDCGNSSMGSRSEAGRGVDSVFSQPFAISLHISAPVLPSASQFLDHPPVDAVCDTVPGSASRLSSCIVSGLSYKIATILTPILQKKKLRFRVSGKGSI